jgi:hypothetical protein
MKSQQAAQEELAPAKQHAKCFVIMPFGIPDLEDLYDEFILPVLESCEMDCARGNDIFRIERSDGER